MPMHQGPRRKTGGAQRSGRKSQPPKSNNTGQGGNSSAADINRRINALVMLLEDKGVLESGEFDDAIMSMKVQMGDKQPATTSRRTGMEVRSRSEYRGAERRNDPSAKRQSGQERRAPSLGQAGHISGHVTDNEAGYPITGVQLILRRAKVGARPIQFRSTKTDQQGRFVFLNLPVTPDSENGEGYIYDLEVRYRNQTFIENLRMELKPGGTTNHNLRIPGSISSVS